MLGFEPWISDVGSDLSTNCATTTALEHLIVCLGDAQTKFLSERAALIELLMSC